jgi:hypothetical protein
VAVPSQELPDAQGAGAVGRSEHDDIADVAGDQLDPAEHERPHQDLAQLGVGLHEPEQLFAASVRRPRRLHRHSVVPSRDDRCSSSPRRKMDQTDV